MPLAALGIGLGSAGLGASGAGGKKAQKKANNLASTELGLQTGQINRANAALQPVGNYWNALLKGGNAAQQAVGPYASLIGQAGQGARNSILATTPRGGEQNLALANTFNDTSNNIARLYAGMQPLAAEGLQNLGGLYFGSAPNPTGAGLGAAGMGLQNAQAGMGGFGSLLYDSINKLRNRGDSGPGVGGI